MKEIILSLALIFLILMMGRTEITLHPFHFSMPGWPNVVGYILIALGLFFLNLDSRTQGYKDGFKDGTDKVIKLLKEQAKEE